MHYEPMDMKFLEEDCTFVQAFANMGCLRFCQKLKGYHWKIVKYIVVNFTRRGTKVGILSFAVSSDTIAHATKIPRSREMWLKFQKIKLQNCDEFLKEEHKGIDMSAGIPRTCQKIFPSS